MKKSFLILSLSLFTLAATAFAKPDPEINEKVRDAFKREFADAKLLSWSEQGEYYKATFLLADSRVIAYFTEEGELEGTIRSVFYNQLPLAVISSLEKRFDDLCVDGINEITNANGTSYKITLESGDKKYKISVDASGNITEKLRIKK